MTLSQATFPRLAQIAEHEVWPLTALVVRIALIGGVAFGAVLALVIPALTPVVFGRAYSDSIVPAQLLIVAGLVWSVQWILARAWAARGQPSLLLKALVVTVATMVVLDLVLIPIWGLVGAATASIVASLTGLVMCLFSYRSRQEHFTARALIPRPSDVTFLLGHARDLFGVG